MSADRLGGFGNNRVVSDDDWRFDPPWPTPPWLARVRWYPRRASDLGTKLPGWRHPFDPRPAGVPRGDEFGPGEPSH